MFFHLAPIENAAKDACDLPRVVIAVVPARVVVVVVRPWQIARFCLELLVSMPYHLSFAI